MNLLAPRPVVPKLCPACRVPMIFGPPADRRLYCPGCGYVPCGCDDD